MKNIIANIFKFLRNKVPYTEKLYYFIFRELKYIIINRNNLVMCKIGSMDFTFEIDPHDKGLSRELVAEKIHEPLTVKVLAEIVNNGNTVVDLGSHLGYFALYEASLAGKTGKVISIEPTPSSYNLLINNIKRNHITNIITHNIAVGREKEIRDFYIGKLSNISSFYKNKHAMQKIQVMSIPLDELLKSEPRIDVIRMDIEGGEYEVIDGMAEILNNFHPILVIELHPSTLRKSFLRKLSELGYECLYKIDRQKNTSMLGGRFASKKDIAEISIKELLQGEDNEFIYEVVLK